MRFALTCRYVKPELVDPAHHWKGVYNAPPASEITEAHVSNGTAQTATIAAGTSVGEAGALGAADPVGPEATMTSASAVVKTTTATDTA